MKKSDLKYFVEEIQTHKFYTQRKKEGEKLYLFQTNDQLYSRQTTPMKLNEGVIMESIYNTRYIRVLVTDLTGGRSYGTDWYRASNELDKLLESLNLGARDLIEVDNIVTNVKKSKKG